MEARGARFCFESCMTDYRREADGKMFVEVNHKEWIETSRLVLAIGHSARDTFGMLHQKQDLVMEAKAFAVGFRVEHPQEMISITSQTHFPQPIQLALQALFNFGRT